MSNLDGRGPIPTGGNRTQREKSSFRFLPGFLIFLIIYTSVKLAGFDVRAILFTVGTYPLTWVEVLHLAASLVAIIELLKVSHPGEDNVAEVLVMLGVWVLYFLFFVLGAAGVRIWIIGFSHFSNTEFLMLTIIFGCQVIVGLYINARTLARSINDNR